MSHTWIQDVNQGFSSEDMGSQQVFRQTLQAMSHPAQWTPVVHDADTPQGVCATSAGIMLALLDAECTVWLSPHLRGQPIAKWLQFHTGCTRIDDPSQADFAWVALGDIWPGLDAFSWGADAQPQSACTILMDVDAASAGFSAMASGPGLPEPTAVTLPTLPERFVQQRHASFAAFPCGPDVLLCGTNTVMGLPRTTALTF